MTARKPLLKSNPNQFYVNNPKFQGCSQTFVETMVIWQISFYAKYLFIVYYIFLTEVGICWCWYSRRRQIGGFEREHVIKHWHYWQAWQLVILAVKHQEPVRACQKRMLFIQNLSLAIKFIFKRGCFVTTSHRIRDISVSWFVFLSFFDSLVSFQLDGPSLEDSLGPHLLFKLTETKQIILDQLPLLYGWMSLITYGRVLGRRLLWQVDRRRARSQELEGEGNINRYISNLTAEKENSEQY